MPELPEVETIRRQLAPWLTGRLVRAVVLVDAPTGPKYARLPQAVDQRISAVNRRGKFLLVELSRGDELVIHLGMTGTLTPLRPARHLRITIELSGRGRRRVYFKDPRRFGRMLVVTAGDYTELPTLARMGPEPLSEQFDRLRFHAALQSAAAIKPLLLSQRPVAGLGNIYADEALWRARIHPLRAARSLTKRKTGQLRQAIVELLAKAVDAGGTTLLDYRTPDGQPGGYRNQLDVYGRPHEPCLRCNAAIRKTVVAGRGTHFCPRCQRLR